MKSKKMRVNVKGEIVKKLVNDRTWKKEYEWVKKKKTRKLTNKQTSIKSRGRLKEEEHRERETACVRVCVRVWANEYNLERESTTKMKVIEIAWDQGGRKTITNITREIGTYWFRRDKKLLQCQFLSNFGREKKSF